MTTMYDSTTAADIPASAQAVAGYVDGLYRWTAADWGRFPGAVHVRIATQPATNDGDVLDCESGDATPQQCPAWVRMRMAAGVASPTVYCSRSVWPQVQQACAGLPVRWWVADWTGHAHALPGAAAVQYADPATSGGHYDLSVITDPTWPSATPAPQPAPVPPPEPRGDLMLHAVTVTTGAAGQPNAGDGDTLTAIPWSTFQAATLQGSDPQVDQTYWPGSVQAQDRDGNVLVCVTGSPAGMTRTVFVLATQ